MQPQDKKGKFYDSQIFHFYESSSFRQHILLALGLLLSFFQCASFIKYFEYC